MADGTRLSRRDLRGGRGRAGRGGRWLSSVVSRGRVSGSGQHGHGSDRSQGEIKSRLKLTADGSYLTEGMSPRTTSPHAPRRTSESDTSPAAEGIHCAWDHPPFFVLQHLAAVPSLRRRARRLPQDVPALWRLDRLDQSGIHHLTGPVSGRPVLSASS
jgi:hypothetical protein